VGFPYFLINEETNMPLELELAKIFLKNEQITNIVATLAADGKLSGYQFDGLRKEIMSLVKNYEQELKLAGFTIDDIRNTVNAEDVCCNSSHQTITREFMLKQIISLRGFYNTTTEFAEEGFYLALTLNNAIENSQLFLDEYKHLSDKDFGLIVSELPFSKVLFTARKNNIDIKTAWLHLPLSIAKKTLFKQRIEDIRKYEKEVDEFFRDF